MFLSFFGGALLLAEYFDFVLLALPLLFKFWWTECHLYSWGFRILDSVWVLPAVYQWCVPGSDSVCVLPDLDSV